MRSSSWLFLSVGLVHNYKNNIYILNKLRNRKNYNTKFFCILKKIKFYFVYNTN